jgi:glucose-1-phosphate thymidylyltransferase
MKGVVLAGGTGSRLFPLTKITDKHLLPIYDRPMIYYPIQTLVDAGIQDIMIVTGGRNSGDFLRLLANGKQFGLKHITYTYQEGAGGIADALALAEHFADGQKICVVLVIPITLQIIWRRTLHAVWRKPWLRRRDAVGV